MTAALRIALLGLVLFLAQAMVVEIVPSPLRPDLVLIFALAMGLRRRSALRGLMMAFGLGFAFDVLSGSPLGLYSLLRGTACAATRMLDRALYLRAPLPWGLYCGVFALIDGVLLAFVLRGVAPHVALPWSEVLLAGPAAAPLTALCAAALLSTFNRLDADSDRDPSWMILSSTGHRIR